MLITLKNDYHNTETVIRVTNGRVSNRAGRNAWKNLCGVDGCICGGILGQRGGQRHNGAVVQIAPDFANGGDRRGNHSADVQIRDDL